MRVGASVATTPTRRAEPRMRTRAAAHLGDTCRHTFPSSRSAPRWVLRLGATAKTIAASRAVKRCQRIEGRRPPAIQVAAGRHGPLRFLIAQPSGHVHCGDNAVALRCGLLFRLQRSPLPAQAFPECDLSVCCSFRRYVRSASLSRRIEIFGFWSLLRSAGGRSGRPSH
jgi:hypothetical protein